MDQVPTTQGIIELTDSAIAAQQLAQIRGTVIEAGPTATETNATTPGARVICRRYAGELVEGMDGLLLYRVMNDKDIWATFEKPALDRVVTESTDRLS